MQQVGAGDFHAALTHPCGCLHPIPSHPSCLPQRARSYCHSCSAASSGCRARILSRLLLCSFYRHFTKTSKGLKSKASEAIASKEGWLGVLSRATRSNPGAWPQPLLLSELETEARLSHFKTRNLELQGASETQIILLPLYLQPDSSTGGADITPCPRQELSLLLENKV